MAKKAAKQTDTPETKTFLAEQRGRLLVEQWPIDTIKPAPYNPRVTLQPGDPDWEAIAASLDRFGLVEPLIVNTRTGYLVGGHQRLAVLTHKGWTHVPVALVNLSEAEEKALSLALNKVEGDWDRYKLKDVLAELTDPKLFEATGFTINDLAELTAELTSVVETPDSAFVPSLEPAVTRSNVTAKDVQSAEAAQSDKFVHGRGPKDVTCPNCAFVFGVGGWLKDYIEETEKMQAEAAAKPE